MKHNRFQKKTEKHTTKIVEQYNKYKITKQYKICNENKIQTTLRITKENFQYKE